MVLDGSRMSSWQIHWLEAEGDLRPWCKDITSEIEAAHDAISQLIVPPRLDIIIQRFTAGPVCLNNFSASISGASAGVRLPSGVAAG